MVQHGSAEHSGSVNGDGRLPAPAPVDLADAGTEPLPQDDTPRRRLPLTALLVAVLVLGAFAAGSWWGGAREPVPTGPADGVRVSAQAYPDRLARDVQVVLVTWDGADDVLLSVVAGADSAVLSTDLVGSFRGRGSPVPVDTRTGAALLRAAGEPEAAERHDLVVAVHGRAAGSVAFRLTDPGLLGGMAPLPRAYLGVVEAGSLRHVRPVPVVALSARSWGRSGGSAAAGG